MTRYFNKKKKKKKTESTYTPESRPGSLLAHVAVILLANRRSADLVTSRTRLRGTNTEFPLPVRRNLLLTDVNNREHTALRFVSLLIKIEMASG